jgi:O-phosphoseryl-tRNA synthetase
MIKTGITDIRQLVYPHLGITPQYTDSQLAEMIEVARTPRTEEGKKLVKVIVQAAIKHANQRSPCQFLAYKGQFLDRTVKVHIYEPDSDKNLLGPAALNTIYAFDGSILGVPEEGWLDNEIVKKARENGISSGIRYLDSVAALAVSSMEERIRSGRAGAVNIRVKIAKLPSDVNVRVRPTGISYVTSRNKRIVVKGPVFVGIKLDIV